MRETGEKRIKTTLGEVVVHVQQLPAMKAFRLLSRLGRDLGPALALFAKGDAGIEQGVRLLFEAVTPEELEAVTRELLQGAQLELQTADGRKLVDLLTVFDSEFRGEMGAILQVLVHAVTVNYGNFFAEAVALGQQATAKVSGLKASGTSSGPRSA